MMQAFTVAPVAPILFSTHQRNSIQDQAGPVSGSRLQPAMSLSRRIPATACGAMK
jgi:hypothetical protein